MLQVKPDRMSSIMLELAAKKWNEDAIQREYDVQLRRRQPGQDTYAPGTYSEFGDQKRYGGRVPTGQQLFISFCRSFARACSN
jgi:hypothetical protein